MNEKKNLLLLYDRPQEPVFVGKGKKKKAVFDVPQKYLPDKYRPIGPELQNHFGELAEDRIPVKDIVIPDLTIPMALKRHEQFSLFIPHHSKMASRLIDIFMEMRNAEELLSVAVYARDRLNPYLFTYALSVALLHRPDTKDVPIPNYFETFPDKFLSSTVFVDLHEEATIVPEDSRRAITIPRDFTASDLDPEHRLWYFREDIGVNLHHWHWHLVYPFEASDRSIVDKDRRGELFYFMHQQLVARYNFERFSNNLRLVRRFNNFREPIEEGYFPKLDNHVASRAWPGRAAWTQLRDIHRSDIRLTVDLETMERWRDRLFDTIHQGYVVDTQGKKIMLNNDKGIDILGNIIEASILSPNEQLYGNLHNLGHVFFGYAHDPDHKYLESFGVMGDTTTSMRDPVFYRWHTYMNDIFQEHKMRLSPYTEEELTFPKITINACKVQIDNNGENNCFRTFFKESEVNLARGLDFVPQGDVYAKFTHLDYEHFTYIINVTNDSGTDVLCTARIFLSPKYDVTGAEMTFADQRMLMIEQDRFVITCRPGVNTVRRRSTESNLTISFDRTYRDLDDIPPAGTDAAEEFIFCGCGWPQNMLIPKGTPQGLPCQLFVMLSDYMEDRVEQDLVGTCNDAFTFCGVRNRRYPDRRPMGYPFDRLPRNGVDDLSTFLTPNMIVTNVRIYSNDELPNPEKHK